MSGPGISIRHPTEGDYAPVVGVVDGWWGGRQLHPFLPRLWFQHFADTSLIAENPSAEIVGFLVGFRSPDDPRIGYAHMIATHPEMRREGVGRQLYARFFSDMRDLGVREVRAITWPGNEASIAFHRALGFRLDESPGTVLTYGVPTHPGYDFGTEDRVVFVHELGTDVDQALVQGP